MNNFRGGSRIFFRRGYTRLLLYFNTNKPHSSFFFLQNTNVLENRRSSQGGVRTPCTLPLDPPLHLASYDYAARSLSLVACSLLCSLTSQRSRMLMQKRPLLHWTSMLWSIDNCQNMVSADQCYMYHGLGCTTCHTSYESKSYTICV